MARRASRDEYGFERGHIRGGSTVRNINDLAEIKTEVIEAAKAALSEGVELIVADAKSRCPVKTGKLRESIHAKPVRGAVAYNVVADAYRTDARGRKYYYGGNVEFNPKINKPFLYPAIEAKRAEVYNMIDRAVRNAIRSE